MYFLMRITPSLGYIANAGALNSFRDMIKLRDIQKEYNTRLYYCLAFVETTIIQLYGWKCILSVFQSIFQRTRLYMALLVLCSNYSSDLQMILCIFFFQLAYAQSYSQNTISWSSP